MRIEQLYRHMVAMLQATPRNTVVLLRCRKDESAGLFEETVAKVASVLGLRVVWFAPTGSGREATFHRDYRMVESADLVVAYFAENRIMEGGTGHVVEAALIREIPVTAWSVSDRIERVGEIEPSDLDGSLYVR